MKIFFTDNIQWSSKKFWKMIAISADVKANKNINIKDLVALSILQMFKDVCSKLEMQYNGTCIFIWFWLLFYPFWYCLLRTRRG